MEKTKAKTRLTYFGVQFLESGIIERSPIRNVMKFIDDKDDGVN